MPDDVPLIGGLDDLVVVVLAVDLFLDGVPRELLEEKLAELGIDRAAFDRDIAQIRRLTPGPVRRTIRRVPGLIAGAAAMPSSDPGSRPACGPGSPRRNPHRVKVILTAGRRQARQERRDEAVVADGYATNFLIPQKLAVPAAGGAYRAWQHDIASREDKRKREREEAEIAATRIASTTLTMGVKVGEGGKLYGSITAKDIADALGRRGIEVDRHKIDLEEPLKSLGTYKVAIKVFTGHDARGHDRRRAEGLTDPVSLVPDDAATPDAPAASAATSDAPAAPDAAVPRQPALPSRGLGRRRPARRSSSVASSCSTRSWRSSCSRAVLRQPLDPRDLEPLGRAAFHRGRAGRPTSIRPASCSSRCCRS